ncbi:hypothetical protein HDU67_007596 [Dinochytrium kinnereticum]|nr:hypothetical protein HDU67_007596 [Dinochytrium kinnereticum]
MTAFRTSAIRPIAATLRPSLAFQRLRSVPSLARRYTTVTDDVEEQIQRLNTLVSDVKSSRTTADESLRLLVKEIEAVEERLTEMKRDYDDGNACRHVFEKKAKKAELLAEMYRVGLLLVSPRMTRG